MSTSIGVDELGGHLTYFNLVQLVNDQRQNTKALKETSWSSRSGLNPTRTTPPNNESISEFLQCNIAFKYIFTLIYWQAICVTLSLV